ncbi:hypothetical protein STEG23_029985 [Scotinomys teguina]
MQRLPPPTSAAGPAFELHQQHLLAEKRYYTQKTRGRDPEGTKAEEEACMHSLNLPLSASWMLQERITEEHLAKSLSSALCLVLHGVFNNEVKHGTNPPTLRSSIPDVNTALLTQPAPCASLLCSITVSPLCSITVSLLCRFPTAPNSHQTSTQRDDSHQLSTILPPSSPIHLVQQ